jgi:uncharacterized protein (DUF1800 family)
LLCLSVLAGARSFAQGPALEWDAARAEHLLNRAGFGANTAAIERSVALGPEAVVDELLRVEGWIEEPFYARKKPSGDLRKYVQKLPAEEREKRMAEMREEDRAQLADFLDWWVGRLLQGQEPLRERMVLFWHGHFTSSMDVVQSSYEMIQQNQLFRRRALGSFRELLYGVARDPAMLIYLDNATSKKSHPNENFARELLELYTLGEGNYGEEDVREVARAFTGWGQENGRFEFDPKRHDDGKKRVLGVKGKLDGDDVLEILLKQPACARHIAGALLAYFEGSEPEAARLERYAEELRESGYQVDAFLRRLFLDPEFYSERTRASRIASPLDYLVGTARRLGVAPDATLLVKGAKLLGQALFFPPSVRGWEGGWTWATGSSLVLRGEMAGLFLGRVSRRALFGGGEEEASMMEASAAMTDGDAPRPARRGIGRLDLNPRINLTQRLCRDRAPGDAELARALVAELLAIPAPEGLVRSVEGRLAAARDEHGLGAEPWSSRPEIAEPFLRELAHGILALPEGQLD